MSEGIFDPWDMRSFRLRILMFSTCLLFFPIFSFIQISELSENSVAGAGKKIAETSKTYNKWRVEVMTQQKICCCDKTFFPPLPNGTLGKARWSNAVRAGFLVSLSVKAREEKKKTWWERFFQSSEKVSRSTSPLDEQIESCSFLQVTFRVCNRSFNFLSKLRQMFLVQLSFTLHLVSTLLL